MRKTKNQDKRRKRERYSVRERERCLHFLLPPLQSKLKRFFKLLSKTTILPSLSPPLSSLPPPPLYPPTTAVSQAQSPLVKKPMEAAVAAGVTLEHQRKMAKELQDYFKQKKLEEAADRGPFFGFIAKNEIANGRWAMFGFAVGLLTEFATGSDFVQQLKILLSNFGIVDLD